MFRSLAQMVRPLEALDAALREFSWEPSISDDAAPRFFVEQGLLTLENQRNLSAEEIAYFVSKVSSISLRRRLLRDFEDELWQAVEQRRRSHKQAK